MQETEFRMNFRRLGTDCQKDAKLKNLKCSKHSKRKKRTSEILVEEDTKREKPTLDKALFKDLIDHKLPGVMAAAKKTKIGNKVTTKNSSKINMIINLKKPRDQFRADHKQRLKMSKGKWEVKEEEEVARPWKENSEMMKACFLTLKKLKKTN